MSEELEALKKMAFKATRLEREVIILMSELVEARKVIEFYAIQLTPIWGKHAKDFLKRFPGEK